MTTVAIVLAGGRGTRFSESQPNPKPLIAVLGQTQLFWATKGAYLSYNPDFFIFASRTDLVNDIRAEIESFDFLFSYEVVDVGIDTYGPAHTVELALERNQRQFDDSKIVIIDNDCFNLVEGQLKDIKFPFVTSTFSKNPAHCFIELSENNSVLALHEKHPKGNTVVSGNYAFTSPRQFLDSLDLVRRDLKNNQELFLSSVMDKLIQVENVQAVHVTEYFSLGTPTEIDNVDSKLGRYK